MMGQFFRRRSAVALGIVLLGVAALATMAPHAEVARGAPAKVLNAPELTAQWWKWVYSLPVSENPQFDETGANAANGQPFEGSQVFFLAGVLNVSGTAERYITVPA